MKADVILKLVNNKKHFATIKKRFDVPEGLTTDMPTLTIKLIDGQSIQPGLHMDNYDMDSQVATLTSWDAVAIDEFVGDEPGLFSESLEENGWQVDVLCDTTIEDEQERVVDIEKHEPPYKLLFKFRIWFFIVLTWLSLTVMATEVVLIVTGRKMTVSNLIASSWDPGVFSLCVVISVVVFVIGLGSCCQGVKPAPKELCPKG